MNIKNNLSLIFGISIPILMIIFVALSIYIPQLFIKPQYDFLYLVGRNHCYIGYNNNYNTVYEVKNNKLVKNTPDGVVCQDYQKIKFYFYDIKANQSKEISYDEARRLYLTSSVKSPDGFEITSGGSGGGFFPFFSSRSDYGSRYISGHNISKRLDISQKDYYYEFVFLGWIIK